MSVGYQNPTLEETGVEPVGSETFALHISFVQIGMCIVTSYQYTSCIVPSLFTVSREHILKLQSYAWTLLRKTKDLLKKTPNRRFFVRRND